MDILKYILRKLEKTDKQLCCVWNAIDGIGTEGWALVGNSGTTPGTNFLGTTDSQDLVFKTNSTEIARLTTTNRMGLGTSSPNYQFELRNSDNTGSSVLSTLGIVNTNTGSVSIAGIRLVSGSALAGGTISGTHATLLPYGFINGLSFRIGAAGQSIGFSTSDAIITGAATNADVIFKNGGQIQATKYGVGTFTGTPVYNIQLDSSGNFIEQAVTALEKSSSIISSATPVPTGDALRNYFYITALTEDAVMSAPSGTPVNGNRILIRVKDDGTFRTFGWNVIYRSIGFTLPSVTVAGKYMYLEGIYNSQSSTWDILSYYQET